MNVFSKLLPQIKDLNGNTIENIETVFEYDRYACNDFMEKATPLLNREDKEFLKNGSAMTYVNSFLRGIKYLYL